MGHGHDSGDPIQFSHTADALEKFQEQGTIRVGFQDNKADRSYAVQPLNGFSEVHGAEQTGRSEEHTSELQSLMRISYAVFGLKKQNTNNTTTQKSRITQHYDATHNNIQVQHTHNERYLKL